MTRLRTYAPFAWWLFSWACAGLVFCIALFGAWVATS